MSVNAKEVADNLKSLEDSSDKIKRALIAVLRKAEKCEEFAVIAGGALAVALKNAESSLEVGETALKELNDIISHAPPKLLEKLNAVQFLASQSRVEGLSAETALECAKNAASRSGANSLGATSLLTQIIRSLSPDLVVPSEMSASLKQLEDIFASVVPKSEPLSTENICVIHSTQNPAVTKGVSKFDVGASFKKASRISHL